jgi:hypothetical protein
MNNRNAALKEEIKKAAPFGAAFQLTNLFTD